MYFCYFRVVQANPNGFDNPILPARTVALDLINPSAPAGCTTNPAEPWCFGNLGITQGCATHPATYIHYCAIPQPPNPIRTPMVWVDEAERCVDNFTLSDEQELALLNLVRPLVPGLVVTEYNFKCYWQQGDAFYQHTFKIAAGSDLNVFAGSAKIVDFLNKQKSTLCRNADPLLRPIFCQSPPLGDTDICSIDQYDEQNVLICPRSPGNLALSIAAPNCRCGAQPGDSDTYKTNLLQWVNDITRTQNKQNVINSIDEYACVDRQGPGNINMCQYQYRVRVLPRDDFTDALVSLQYLEAEIAARPYPCNEDAGNVYDFCTPGAYWEKAKGCAAIWDRTQPLECVFP